MSSSIGSGEPGDKFVSEDDLKNLLERWITPEPSKTLDQRVANSYHMEFGSTEMAGSILLPPSHEEVVKMKFCSTCKEEFADKFSFCPVDGTPLNAVAVAEPEVVHTPPPPVAQPIAAHSPMMVAAAAAGGGMAMVPRDEFHFTFMDDAGLTSRLFDALKGVAHESELTWPEFKKDPFGFTKRGAVGYGQAGWRVLSQPNVATGVLSALVILIAAIIGVVLMDRFQVRLDLAKAAKEEQLILESMVDIPSEQPTPDVGTAGENKGKGGGSKPKQEKAGGGGGGGREDPKPASFGKTPQASLTVPQVVAPDPKPPRIINPALPVAATVVADPMLVLKKLLRHHPGLPACLGD